MGFVMTEWHYRRGDQQYGPKGIEVIEKLMNGGIITPDTVVWREGLEIWVPAGQTELFQKPPGSSAPQPKPQRAPPLAPTQPASPMPRPAQPQSEPPQFPRSQLAETTEPQGKGKSGWLSSYIDTCGMKSFIFQWCFAAWTLLCGAWSFLVVMTRTDSRQSEAAEAASGLLCVGTIWAIPASILFILIVLTWGSHKAPRASD